MASGSHQGDGIWDPETALSKIPDPKDRAMFSQLLAQAPLVNAEELSNMVGITPITIENIADASQPTARQQVQFAKQKYTLKQMDFNHLECIVLAQGNEDQILCKNLDHMSTF